MYWASSDNNTHASTDNEDGDEGNVSSDVNLYSFLDEVLPCCVDELDTYCHYSFPI